MLVYINGKKHTPPDPTLTLLEYLRSVNLVGTKLGCQEGGCGACTVSLQEFNGKSVETYAVNACIMPLISTDGKHVITVEGVGCAETPHEIQESIAKCGGTQCGFCTPGIVMSLYSLTNKKGSKNMVNESLDGNLCRCTGYKPILSAAYKTMNTKSVPIFPHALKKYKPSLIKFEGDFLLYKPVTINELVSILVEHPKAKIVSGASEFQIEAKILLKEYQCVVFITDLNELKSFEYVPNLGVVFGGNLPLSKLEEMLEDVIKNVDKQKCLAFKALVKQLKHFAGRQIRNVATSAGNIATASPINDLNPIFMALNAKLETLNFKTNKIETFEMGSSELPFFTGYRQSVLTNHIILKITVPETKVGNTLMVFKQSKRKDDDISIVTCCLFANITNMVVTEMRMAFGGVGPQTQLSKCSKLLVNKQLNEINTKEILTELSNEFDLKYDVVGGMAAFRRTLVLSFFYKFMQKLNHDNGLNADLHALKQVNRGLKVEWVRDVNNVYKSDIYGQNKPHLSALRQTTGEAMYVDDTPLLSNELHAVPVMSEHANAKLLQVNYEEALKLPGVIGKVDFSDIPSTNRYGIFKELGPERHFAEGKVEYVGDTIAVIVARTRAIALRASKLVKVEYEVYKPIVTIEQAIEQQSFFQVKNKIKRGDFDTEFKNAAYTFSGKTRMGAQEHFYLETQGCIAIPKDNCHEFELYSSTQNPNETQLVGAETLGISASRIVCKVKRIGGGFGGKESTSVATSTLALLCANKFKRPVRLILSRTEDMLRCGQRHPFLSEWQVCLNTEFKFTGLKVKLYANAGYSMDLTKGVMDRAALHVDNCYDFGNNIDIESKACKTNLASNTAFRGFGAPQGMIVAESILYEISLKLNMSIDLLRQLNYYTPQSKTHYQQNLGIDFSVPEMEVILKQRVKYEELCMEVEHFNQNNKYIKRGIATVPTKFGVAFGVAHLNQAGALVHIYEDGSVLVSHGGVEMGQGLHTKMAMVCANELQVSFDNVFISETSTQCVANASPTAASASSDLNGMAIKNACDQLNKRLLPYRQSMPNASFKEISKSAYLDRVNLSANGFYKMPDIGYTFDITNKQPKNAFFYYTQGVAISVVELDTLTGDFQNLKTSIIMDIGRPINQQIDYGQIEGAFVQGQGLFTIEESLWDLNGKLLTRGPGAYKIPSFKDVPEQFDLMHLQTKTYKHLKTINQSKGIGEPPLFLGCTPMFALMNAINYRRRELNLDPMTSIDAPLTSEKIRMAIGDELGEMGSVDVCGRSFSVRA